jgi:hypothetical protein
MIVYQTLNVIFLCGDNFVLKGVCWLHIETNQPQMVHNVLILQRLHRHPWYQPLLLQYLLAKIKVIQMYSGTSLYSTCLIYHPHLSLSNFKVQISKKSCCLYVNFSLDILSSSRIKLWFAWHQANLCLLLKNNEYM